MSLLLVLFSPPLSTRNEGGRSQILPPLCHLSTGNATIILQPSLLRPLNAENWEGTYSHSPRRFTRTGQKGEGRQGTGKKRKGGGADGNSWRKSAGAAADGKPQREGSGGRRKNILPLIQA